MKLWRTALATLVAAVLLGLLLLAGTTSRAQAPAGQPSTSPEEQELLDLLEKNQLVTARRKVDALLKSHPDSMVGHYVLGRVMNESEGNLPQAMHHLGKAREIYEGRYSVHPRSPDAPWMFHRELLYAIQSVAQRMEEFDYQLEILDYHDLLYDPNLTGEHAWPLMRLGKFTEAREAARSAARMSDPYQRELGLNALCAIEGEARKRDWYFKACLEAYDNARATDVEGVDVEHRSSLAVHAYNAALAARAQLLPEEAERIAREGTRRLAFTTANPWRLLVQLYSDQGRTKEAVDALRDMQAWRKMQPPELRDQMRAETDVAFSTVLLLAADTDTGLRLLDMALDRPDRRGLTSSTREQALGAHALLRRALALTEGELIAEKASYSDDPGLLERAYGAAGRRFSVWGDEERIVISLTDDDRLVSTLRVFLRGGIEPLPVWLLGDLADVLGPGIVGVALERARRLEEDPRVDPYFDAIEAEVALVGGANRRALRLAQTALESLPKSEGLLRGRVAAVAARAADELGQRSVFLALLEQAMQLDPSVIRRLRMSIPASIQLASDSKTGSLLAERLADSPRLHREKDGFGVQIFGADRELQVCLNTPVGTRLSCAVAPPLEPDPSTGEPPPETNTQYVARVAEAFHRQALAMPLGLSRVDLNSLDGTTTVAEQAARDRLRGVLKDAVDKQETP